MAQKEQLTVTELTVAKIVTPTGVTLSLPAASVAAASIAGAGLGNYANDAAAAVGLVPIGGLYHTTGTVKVRLV
jgi:hypothetical protein